jgi:uncharacterized membrane-anchored protein
MRTKVIICLAIPILCLMALTASKAYKEMAGKKFTLDIVGFDPRDLLSGHYLTYRVKYLKNSGSICSYKENGKKKFYCFDNMESSDKSKHPPNCKYLIEGICERSRFKVGIERFYIPEEFSVELDRVVRDQKGKIIVSVNTKGDTQVSNLLINNIDWKKYLKENPKK